MFKNIGQFKISMKNPMLGQCFKSIKYLYEYLNSLFLAKIFFLLEIGHKITLVTIFHDEIEVVSSFFDVIEFDDVIIIACFEYFDLVLEKLVKFTCNIFEYLSTYPYW